MQLMLSKLKMRFSKKVFGCAVAAFMLTAQSFALAQTEPVSAVLYQEDGALAKELGIPLYEWTAPQATPKGIVIAIHGVAMHGRSYDYLGKTLAQEGFLVYAADMHGYGRCVDNRRECKIPDCKHKIDYQKSYADLAKLARALRAKYPSLPIFGVGESLGGAMAIRMAAKNPELIDGLVLSAPAIRRHSLIDPYMIVNAGLFISNPRASLDLMPFVRRYASDDPRVVEEKENDPLMRRKMTAYELLKSTKAIRQTISYVPEIPADTPVLVIQGGGDRILHADAVITLLSKLHSQDQTVKWFSQRGHILLETDYVKPDTMETVVGWLNTHVQSPAVQSKCNRTQDYVATQIPADGVERASFRVQLDPEDRVSQN